MERTYEILQALVKAHERITGESLIGDEMKAHKLMYFAQKTSLVLTGETLFNEKFEGWVYGPVLPSLRNIFKHFKEEEFSDFKLNATETYIIDNTVHTYGKYDSYTLSKMSHEELSWKNSRKGMRTNQRGYYSLKIDDIRKDAENMRIYDHLYDMYLDEFDDIDEEEFRCVE
ncbi:Panacea domain-containing protein [Staphylococcus massiliensis]|uniref:Antitoxin SocA-like Panacea domain-containing protein n=1 Tax=Staphylococcus massiliensis S46 TaxID=1229783 RepID=K9ARC8_9STAP|nr:type II toxin-antitoxin system antitoxin SocA domain-containing protein [Staphylococcus massiliensis]EKU49829.1 hypothetical protein C273_02995 [Staphylococcus massiliensis S46]MCG3398935.1 DUF4065 domain-containing protein [Staphylococcus massiliensis]MCG3401063.1 DUF4065 domain-containing protein [Staphylococcus massiliensis]MCG3413479.1 DUF4065 domain-containing protein [Staphylococcus massiliensis]PNZ99295.1 DUF4065 domain-containing protein [Staphylococcus massiliensis CCUG 55927]